MCCKLNIFLWENILNPSLGGTSKRPILLRVGLPVSLGFMSKVGVQGDLDKSDDLDVQDSSLDWYMMLLTSFGFLLPALLGTLVNIRQISVSLII